MKECRIIWLLFATIWPVTCWSVTGVGDFLKEVVKLEGRASVVVSLLKMDLGATRKMVKILADEDIFFASVDSIPGSVLEERTVFLVDLLDDDTPKLLRKAQNLGLLKSPSRWIMLMYIENFTAPRITPTEMKTRYINNDDKGDNYVEENVTLIHENEILKDSISAEEIVENRLSDIDISVFSEVLIAFVDRKLYDAKMVYRRRSNLPLVWESYGRWSSFGGFVDLRSNEVTSLRRRNFEKTPINICTVLTNNDTINHLGDYVDKHIDPMTKVNHYFTSHMVEFVNGTIHVSFIDSWGYRQPNGSYDGLVNELGSGRADIAGSPLIMDKDRMPWVEYVCVNSPMKTLFIFRKPPLSTVEDIFVLPFSSGVWLSMLVLIVMVSVCLFVTGTWEDTSMAKREGRTRKERVADAFLDALSLVFQQGTWKEPSFSSGRTVLFMGLLSFMFLYTSYSAYIVALLQSPTDSINTLADLLDSPLRLGVQDTLYNRFFFPAETEPVRKAIWERKLLARGDKIFLPVEEGVKLLRQGLFAFHVEKTIAYDLVLKTFLEEEKCHFKEIEFLKITHPYFSIARDSPFKELFKIRLRKLKAMKDEDISEDEIVDLEG